MERQRLPLAPPGPADREALDDYSSILQDNLRQLFQSSHKHRLRTVAPADNEGSVGDIFLVQSNSTFSIYVKFPSGWKSTPVT
jgi:hypothetical protein